jgi:hypothetical protein
MSALALSCRTAHNLDPASARSWKTDPPTPHDLRRTLATRLAELGVAKEDRDAVLNHTPRDVGKSGLPGVRPTAYKLHCEQLICLCGVRRA